MGRADLIGNGNRHLVPSYQPAGTGKASCATPHKRKGAIPRPDVPKNRKPRKM